MVTTITVITKEQLVLENRKGAGGRLLGLSQAPGGKRKGGLR